jgi:hypothetical protein
MAPYCLAIVIVLRRKFIGACVAFLDGLFAIPPEHQVGGAQMSISGITLEALQGSRPGIVIFATCLL